MKLADYIKSLDQEGREEYAKRCGTTLNYLNTHILHANKEPRKRLRTALAIQSGGKVSIKEVLNHFGIGSTAL